MTTADDLARVCDLVVAARWRGDDAAAAGCAAWLEAHWSPVAPAEPADPPAAVSLLGGAGTGVRWHAKTGALLGYVRGRQGCYCIPADASPPPPPAPWLRTEDPLVALWSL
jgi:hypothetical protein